jgi:hypothetical protein
MPAQVVQAANKLLERLRTFHDDAPAGDATAAGPHGLMATGTAP